jgi:nitrate/nitrite transporter NarK
LLRDNLDSDHTGLQGHSHGSFLQMLGDPKVYMLSLAYFFLLGATYTVVFTLPSLIRGWEIKDLVVLGILAAIPQLAAIGGMVLVGRRSDRHRERRWHYAFSTALAATGLGLVTVVQGTSSGQIAGSVIGLTIAYIGLTSATPLFFTLTSEYLSKAAAAGGIALISSLGNLGPAVTPYLNVKINSMTGSSTYGLYLVMAMYLVSALIILTAVKAAAHRSHPIVPATVGAGQPVL